MQIYANICMKMCKYMSKYGLNKQLYSNIFSKYAKSPPTELGSTHSIKAPCSPAPTHSNYPHVGGHPQRDLKK